MKYNLICPGSGKKEKILWIYNYFKLCIWNVDPMVWTSGHCHRVAAESQGIWHLTKSTCPRGGQNIGVCSMTLRCMECAVKWKIPAPKNHPAVVPVRLHLATLPNRSPSVNTNFTVNSFLVCHKLQIWKSPYKIWHYNSYLKTGMYVIRKVFIWKILDF